MKNISISVFTFLLFSLGAFADLPTGKYSNDYKNQMAIAVLQNAFTTEFVKEYNSLNKKDLKEHFNAIKTKEIINMLGKDFDSEKLDSGKATLLDDGWIELKTKNHQVKFFFHFGNRHMVFTSGEVLDTNEISPLNLMMAFDRNALKTNNEKVSFNLMSLIIQDAFARKGKVARSGAGFLGAGLIGFPIGLGVTSGRMALNRSVFSKPHCNKRLESVSSYVQTIASDCNMLAQTVSSRKDRKGKNIMNGVAATAVSTGFFGLAWPVALIDWGWGAATKKGSISRQLLNKNNVKNNMHYLVEHGMGACQNFLKGDFIESKNRFNHKGALGHCADKVEEGHKHFDQAYTQQAGALCQNAVEAISACQSKIAVKDDAQPAATESENSVSIASSTANNEAEGGVIEVETQEGASN